ncbi:MAG: pilus assembly protein [Deltaproteobacteria bacterium]|nr:pilus assembly protein [Deltaproteobacteria bacterium]
MKTQNRKIGQNGAATVEFAIILPMLVLLILGTIEFGLMFYNKQILTNASREAARAAITGITVSEVKQIVLNYCNGRLLKLDGFINLSAADIDVPSLDGSDLSVAVSFDYNFLLSQIIGIINPITISGRTIMRMEPTAG